MNIRVNNFPLNLVLAIGNSSRNNKAELQNHVRIAARSASSVALMFHRIPPTRAISGDRINSRQPAWERLNDGSSATCSYGDSLDSDFTVLVPSELNHHSENRSPKRKRFYHEEHEGHEEEKRFEENDSKHLLLVLLRDLRVLRGSNFRLLRFSRRVFHATKLAVISDWK